MIVSELVEKLPDEIQPFAERYINLWVNKSLEDTEILINSLLNGGFEESYMALVRDMPTEDLIEELERVNQAIQVSNAENAAYLDAKRVIVGDAIKTLIGVVKTVMTV